MLPYRLSDQSGSPTSYPPRSFDQGLSCIVTTRRISLTLTLIPTPTLTLIPIPTLSPFLRYPNPTLGLDFFVTTQRISTMRALFAILDADENGTLDGEGEWVPPRVRTTTTQTTRYTLTWVRTSWLFSNSPQNLVHPSTTPPLKLTLPPLYHRGERIPLADPLT